MKKLIVIFIPIYLISTAVSGAEKEPAPEISRKIGLPSWNGIAGSPRAFVQWTKTIAYKAVLQLKQIHLTKIKIAKAGFFTAAAAVTMYGIINGAKRLFTTSDNTIIRRAEQSYTETAAAYQPVTNIVFRYCDYRVPHYIDVAGEKFREELFGELAQHKNAIPDVTTVEKTLNKLEQQYERVHYRANDLSYHFYDGTITPEIRETYNRMCETERKIAAILPPMRSLHYCLANYPRYFESHN